MVFPGEMTTTTNLEQRSKNLHNFPLPNLWGSQRHLKCMKVVDSVTNGGSSGDHRLRRRSPPSKFADSSFSIPFRFGEANNSRLRNAAFKSGSEEGIEEFRVKIMSDLKTVRDKITQSMFRNNVVASEEQEIEGSGSGSGQEKEREISPVKPWNLRKRRAACKEPVSGNHNNTSNQINKGCEEKRIVMTNSSALRGGVVEAETKKMRPKFSVKLSKEEIEEDFMAMLGHRPPRRPKKRPRIVQKKLDTLFPGLYLTEVTLDSYKV